MQDEPFDPTGTETVGTMIGGVIYIVWNISILVLVCVIMYLIGRAVVG